MQFFAITPERVTSEVITRNLEQLIKKGVTKIYLRNRILDADLLKSCINAGIHPIVHHTIWHPDLTDDTGIHFKTDEWNGSWKLEKLLITASAHKCKTAIDLLKTGVDFVYLSPVFRPFSKVMDKRPLIQRHALKSLLDQYGERIILLGGMTLKRVEELKRNLNADFSVGGITMFFSDHFEN